jgi:hydroxypyruvate reductase
MAPHPGVSLADMRALTRELLACGARVDEINTLRRHLDQIKGGGVARRVVPAPVVSLILSDVVGDTLAAIASGPTAPDPTARADALAVLQRYALESRLPASLLAALRRAPETPKPGEAIFDFVHNVVVGSNELAAQAAQREAEAHGWRALPGRTDWQGEAREAARALCREFKAHLREPRPFCLIAGGETTVTVRGPGRGGRNQELALAAVRELADVYDVMLIALATDGDDGPTDAAGAVVTGETLRRAQTLSLTPEDYLNRNDAYTFFHALGDLLRPGPTGTNVNDLMFLFAF